MRVLIACLAGLVFCCAAPAASFDCERATSAVEKLICADPALSKLDKSLNSAYRQKLAHADDKNRLLQEQRDWIKSRRNVCGSVACLRKAYESRLKALSAVPKAAAAPKPKAEPPKTAEPEEAAAVEPLPEPKPAPIAAKPEPKSANPPLASSEPQVVPLDNGREKPKPIHPQVFALIKPWISDSTAPVVTEISLEAMEKDENQFNYDAVTEASGIVEYKEEREGVEERKYYKLGGRDTGNMQVDYFESSGGSTTEHVRFRCRLTRRSIEVDGVRRDIRVLQLLSIDSRK